MQVDKLYMITLEVILSKQDDKLFQNFINEMQKKTQDVEIDDLKSILDELI